MQLARDVVHALIPAEDPVRDGLAHLANQTLHVEVLEHGADDRVREQIRGRQREHEPGRYAGERLEKVGRVLRGCRQLTSAPRGANTYRVPAERGLARHEELRQASG